MLLISIFHSLRFNACNIEQNDERFAEKNFENQIIIKEKTSLSLFLCCRILGWIFLGLFLQVLMLSEKCVPKSKYYLLSPDYPTARWDCDARALCKWKTKNEFIKLSKLLESDKLCSFQGNLEFLEKQKEIYKNKACDLQTLPLLVFE